MKITYASPNASHHYYYAKYLDQAKHLKAFISGWPRFARKSREFHLNAPIVRADFFQTLYLLQGGNNGFLASLSNQLLDSKSYRYAIESDIFLYYRTAGVNTLFKIKRQALPTICIVEEVNSHILSSHRLILDEYSKVGLDPYQYPHPYDLRKRLDAYQASDFILCPSTYVKQSFLNHGFSASKIIVNPYGMPFAAPNLAKTTSDNGQTFRILFVGQINIRKGLRYLIKAFANISYLNKELLLVGPKTSVTGLENMSIPENVRFTGILKGDDLANAYATSSVFVLPSVDEGMALVQGEALSFGLPLIATTNTGSQDLITHGIEGLIVKPCDAKALQEAIESLIESPDILQKMRLNALKRSQEFCTWPQSTDNLLCQLGHLLVAKTGQC